MYEPPKWKWPNNCGDEVNSRLGICQLVNISGILLKVADEPADASLPID